MPCLWAGFTRFCRPSRLDSMRGLRSRRSREGELPIMRERDEALQSLAEGISVHDAELLLASLRGRGPDTIETNHFGERVWLKAAFDQNGKRIGITECCFTDDPCARHAAMQEASEAK